MFDVREKHELLQAYLKETRRDRDGLDIVVRRADIVGSMLSALDAAARHPADLLQPWFITFAGESGIGRGVTDDAIALFFDKVSAPECKMFCDDGAHVVLPVEDAPAATESKTEAKAAVVICNDKAFFCVGVLLLKCLIDERPVGVRFAPSLFKYLLDLPPALVDLAEFSSSLHNSAL